LHSKTSRRRAQHEVAEMEGIMATARIEAIEARQRVQSGQALLVCAYDDEAKCATMKLEGAISLGAFEARSPSLPKNQEIVFYCA
jgi:hypothetical protein